ncbi:hypothetical protein RJ639_005542, partial [Escallonia herrerae]
GKQLVFIPNNSRKSREQLSLKLHSLGIAVSVEDGKNEVELKPSCLFKHDKNVEAIVVGVDQYINFYKQQ